VSYDTIFNKNLNVGDNPQFTSDEFPSLFALVPQTDNNTYVETNYTTTMQGSVVIHRTAIKLKTI